MVELTSDALATSWLPEAGMLGASLVHGGAELLWQGPGPQAYARTRAYMGMPFLHPWANRIDGLRYEANGRSVTLDPESPLVLLEGGLPIHGLLNASPLWEVRESDDARLLAALEFDR